MYLFAFFLVLYEFTTYAANDLIMPGMIQVVNYFHAPIYYVALSLSFYILGNCVFLAMAGYLSERYGKRRIILAGNFLFLLFTVIIIFSVTIHQFMLWRLFQGAGLAVIAIGYAVIHENFNDKTAIKLAALMANVSVLAPLVGPVIGSAIVNYFSWQYVFVLTAILSSIAFVGLYLYTPKSILPASIVSLGVITRQYGQILKNKEFLLGSLCCTFCVTVLLIWIGQAPNLVLYKLHQDYTHYVIYQIISIGGLTLSSMLIQFVVGRFKIYSIVKMGAALMLLGVSVSLLGSNHIEMIVSGLFIYSLGLGFANGCIMRLILSIKGYSQGMLASMLGFLETFLFVVVLTLMNEYFSFFDFTLWSFTLSSFVFGLIAFVLVTLYIAPHKNREWH